VFGLDRLVAAALALAGDARCVNGTVEARYRDPDDFVEEAADVFRACRLVVIRDAFDGDYVAARARQLADYVHALQADARGATTLGERRIVERTGAGRVAVGEEIKMFPGDVRTMVHSGNGCGERDHSQTSGDLRSREAHSVSRNEPKRPRFERARRVSRFVSPV